MKTENELLEGMKVLTHALHDAGVKFQFSVSMNGHIHTSWSGSAEELLGLSESLKLRLIKSIIKKELETPND